MLFCLHVEFVFILMSFTWLTDDLLKDNPPSKLRWSIICLFCEKYENPYSRPQSRSFLALGTGMENPRNLGIVWACADKSLLCVFLCINFVTKCLSGLVGGGALVHRDVLYMELCHCPVRVMGRDSYNFAFLRGVTNTAFMPARQREMARGYVGYGCILYSFTFKSALTKSKLY